MRFQGKFSNLFSIIGNREGEYNVPNPVAIRLFFRENINALDEGAHEFLLLHFSGGIVDFIEGQKQVIDVVSCDLLLMNVINLTLDFSELGFHVLNQFILLIVTPLQIQSLTVIIGIIKVQCVHLVLQTRFRTESLAELHFDCIGLTV